MANILHGTTFDAKTELDASKANCATDTGGGQTTENEQLDKANEEKNLVRALPGERQVAGWVDQAKGLDRAVHH